MPGKKRREKFVERVAKQNKTVWEKNSVLGVHVVLCHTKAIRVPVNRWLENGNTGRGGAQCDLLLLQSSSHGLPGSGLSSDAGATQAPLLFCALCKCFDQGDDKETVV